MDSDAVRKRVPFLRSCEKETPEPIVGEIQGHIPSWLRGTLVRVGAGLLHVGPDHFNHVFDGLALLHRFSIQDGKVTYLNKFLRSDTYRKNMEFGRIVVNEFSTNAPYPDPCKSIFEKIQAKFSNEDFSDNDLVNIVQYSDEYYAQSEVNFIWRIDPESLDSLKKENISRYVPIKMATAHPHESRDGTVYNIGNAFGWSNGYTVVKFPPKIDKSKGVFDRGTVVARIPYSSVLSPSYYHSFAMTENYIILVEQPIVMSVFGVLFSSEPVSNSMAFTNDKARFHVVRLSDGAVLPIRYTTDALFVFHHINAYEEDGHLIIDMCCYEDGEVLKALYIKSLEEKFSNPDAKYSNDIRARPKRYVLPLEKLLIKNGKKANIVKLSGIKATAHLENDGSVHCTPEILEESEKLGTELPRINYSYNGMKYKYFYAIGTYINDEETSLVKVNVETGIVQRWLQMNTNVSEPVFIAHPNASEEDDGVILSAILNRKEDKEVGLLILDAKTMAEIGRADFKTESSIPADFHGIFIDSNQS